MSRVYFNNFYGKIDGKSIFDYIILDGEINNLEERMDYVYKLLNIIVKDGIEFNGDEYWDEIFVQKNNKSHINLMPNNQTDLYSNSNVAETLEMLGNYILWYDPEKKKIENDNKIKIYYTEKEFRKAIDKEKKYIKEYGEKLDDGITVLKSQKNYKKSKDEVVTAEDLNRFPELREYKKEIDRLSSYIKEDRLDEFAEYMRNKGYKKMKSEKQAKNFLIRHISYLKKDMLECKIKLARPIIWKQPLKDEGGADWEEFDELNNAHIKALLQLYKESNVYDFQSDLGCMFYDLQNVLDIVKLTKKQQEVLNLWMGNMSINDISKKLGKRASTVSEILDKIVDKIVRVYEEQLEDLYYLNIRKGEYKKCSKCGEIKLVSKFNKDGKGGIRSRCKICQ